MFFNNERIKELEDILEGVRAVSHLKDMRNEELFAKAEICKNLAIAKLKDAYVEGYHDGFTVGGRPTASNKRVNVSWDLSKTKEDL